MKIRIAPVKAGSKRPALMLGLACGLAAFATLAQAKVTPPPLPPGSAMVKVQGGMNPDEVKREDKAHHHKGQNKRDFTLDDSDPANNGKGSKK